MIFPGDFVTGYATAFFVATIPQFLHISAAVSNDSLGATLSTAYLLSLINVLKGPGKRVWQVISGVFLGFSILTKTLSLFYIPVTAIFLGVDAIRAKRNPTMNFLIIFGFGTLVGGWWYFRNWLIYKDPTFSKTLETLCPWMLRGMPLSLSEVFVIIRKTFVSFFGHFGSMQFSIPPFHLVLYGVITTFGIVGITRFLVKKEFTRSQFQIVSLLLFSLLGGVGIFAYINIKYSANFMGRYLFIVIAPFAVLAFCGLRSLLPYRWRSPVFILLSFLLIILNLNVLFRVLKPAYAETRLSEGVNQSQFCYPTPEVNSSVMIGQTFVSPRNNLCAIRVMFSSETKRKEGEIIFVFKEAGESGKILHQMGFPLKKIDDTSRYFFIFPPIQNSMGKEYLFIFSSPSVLPGKGVALWYASGDCYPEGRMLVNGKLAEGNLYFQAYYFTGKHPETDWQGRRELVMNQGPFLGLRENQFYSEEMSKEFREQTITHKKIHQAEIAFSNRRSLVKR